MTKRGRPVHPDSLTPAEWRVVEGVRHGLSNPAIAAKLGITTDAVKFHVSNALGKLELADRRELRRWPGVRNDSALANATRVPPMNGWSLGQIARLTRNVESTTTWLRDTIGLPLLFRFHDMSFFECGGTRLYLSQGDPACNSIVYFKVDDVHREVTRLNALGVNIVSAPHRIHVHENGSEEWMAFFTDPDGGMLAVMSVVNIGVGAVA